MVFKYALICAVVMLPVGVSWAGAPSEGQDKGTSQGVERTVESENRRLQGEVAKLQDANGMLVENLTNCAAENEALSEKLAASARTKQASPGQLALIESIRKALSVPSGFDFLSELNEKQLHTLLEAIHGRLK
jgi:hypothetical protein